MIRIDKRGKARGKHAMSKVLKREDQNVGR